MVRRSGVLALVTLLLLGACGASETVPPVTLPPATSPSTTVSAPVPEPVAAPVAAIETAWRPLPLPERSPVWTAAKAEGPLGVFEAPGAEAPFRVLDSHTLLGTPTVVLILGESGDWLQVLLPGRPNGQTGWVRSGDVERFEVNRRAVIDLGSRVLRVLDGDRSIFETSIGVGSPSSPTPTGTFFVTDAVRITNPHGPWGPYAFGLSARSDTVTEFNGGDGIIGIHGTNKPGSIGEAQSLGCVRLPNDIMLRVARLLTVGSPVEISA